MHGLERVGEDRGLVPAAGALLALAEPDVVAQAQPAGDAGQRAHVHHRGAQLGQLPFGQIGIFAEERVGDDQAEHGVAEELQPLVGGQPAVLVGERAVRQGALEQLRAERHLKGLQQLVGTGSGAPGTAAPSSPDMPITLPSFPRLAGSGHAPDDAGQEGLITWRRLYVPQVGHAVCGSLGLAALRAGHELRGRGLPLGPA